MAPERVAALSISNQRETFVPLAAGGAAVRPAIVWLDQRCRGEVRWLSRRVGARRIHEISGKPPDMAPVAYRLAWMLRHETEQYRRTAMFADVHAYLAHGLTGEFRTSWASADPTGLFDLRERRWSPEILRALDVNVEQLPMVSPPGSVIGEVTAEAARATALRAGTPVVAGGGDGQAAGLGVGALSRGRAYLNLGTAVVAGLHSPEYRTGRPWRTMMSCSGSGYVLETSLRSGTFLLDWFVEHFGGGAREALQTAAAEIPLGSGGVLALPYWGAVMTPYWDPNARGCLIGLTATHGPADVYRALLEGIALEQAMVTGMIGEATGWPVEEFVAIGGGASSDLWRQILADVCGTPVRCSRTVEASSLGAAMCAAAGAGWFTSVAEAARAMCGEIGRVNEPDAGRQARYAELREIYAGIYPRLRATFAKLAKFSEGDTSL